MTIQQFVILGKNSTDGSELPTIGTRDEILEKLELLNTRPQRDGEDVLYGPGISIELPPGNAVTQALLTVTEEEIAWLVIQRLIAALDCKLLDPATGRELNA